jgi:hypothetical protein
MVLSGRSFEQKLYRQYQRVLQYTYPTCIVLCILSSCVSAALITNTTFEFKKTFRVYCEAYKRNEMIQFLIERWHCSTTLVSSSYHHISFILFRRGGRVIWNCFRRFSRNSSHLRNNRENLLIVVALFERWRICVQNLNILCQ